MNFEAHFYWKERRKPNLDNPLFKERLTLKLVQNNEFLFLQNKFFTWKSVFMVIFNSLYVWVNGDQEV